MDLTGGFSKLAPTLLTAIAMQVTIRARVIPNICHDSLKKQQQRRVGDEVLRSAAARYTAGATLRVIAADVGISRQRLASLLKERGVRLHGGSPSENEIREMARRYESGVSLAKAGSQLGFSAGRVRNRLEEHGIRLRDTQGRDR